MSYKRQRPIPVAEGGTGLTTITAFGLIVGNGTSTPALVTPSATSGVPVVSAGSSANPVYGTAVVAGGGTGLTSFTAYELIAAGTTSTGNLQQVSGVGTSGQVLTSQGASALPQWANASSLLSITAVNNAASPYTVLTTDQYLKVDSTAGAVSILLPNAPTTGRIINIKDSTAMAQANNITVTTVGGSVNIDGATSYVMNTNYEAINLIFDGTSYEVF